MIGSGVLLAGVGSYLMGSAVSDEADTLKPGAILASDYSARMDEHRSKHTLGVVTLLAGTAVGVGGAGVVIADGRFDTGKTIGAVGHALDHLTAHGWYPGGDDAVFDPGSVAWCLVGPRLSRGTLRQSNRI